MAGKPNREIPGAVTVTDSVRIRLKPGAAALTVVVPPPMGSNAIPPAATLVGEFAAPGTSVTVRVWPAPAKVTSCATAGLVWVIVTVAPGPPVRSC
jgi:hypothetical protein